MNYTSILRIIAPGALIAVCAAAAAIGSPPASVTPPPDWQAAPVAPPHGKQVSLAAYALPGAGFIQNIEVHMVPAAGISFKSFIADRALALSHRGTVVSSHAEKLCGGKLDGWFMDYKISFGARDAEVEQTLAADASAVYMASYTRAVDQAESAPAREALRTLCLAAPAAP